ncbi:MAG: NUDIX domain-containing protein [Nitriliruptoraceae bacterium]|nr:NUDIX domain-containing protein [Nitriliruptoraceae bacterium]
MDERLASGPFWSRLRAALDEVDEEVRTPPANARAGGVLVLLADGDEGPVVVLTRRRHDLRSHPGQVSFPGGRLDPGESVEQAAFREAAEEIALDPASASFVGTGPRFYIPPSRFWVVPVVARWDRPHELTENPWEVDEVLRVPLARFLERDRWRQVPVSNGGSTWAWQLEHDLVWGATAVVLAVLLETAVPGWRDGQRPEDLGDDRTVRPWETAPSWDRRARLEGELPAVAQRSLVHVDAASTRAVRRWLAARGVGTLTRAEHAGRAVAHAARRLVDGDLTATRVTVLAGPSSNGAGGLAAARLLLAAGAEVEVITVGAPRYPQQTHVLRASDVEVLDVERHGLTEQRGPGELVIDAMLGVGGEPPLRDLPERAASWLQRHDVPVIALDLPSGLSADDGLRGPCVTADVTVALGLPTRGMQPAITHPYVGDLYLADVGIPANAWRLVGVGLEASPFGQGPLIRLTDGERASDAGTPDQGQVDQAPTDR